MDILPTVAILPGPDPHRPFRGPRVKGPWVATSRERDGVCRWADCKPTNLLAPRKPTRIWYDCASYKRYLEITGSGNHFGLDSRPTWGACIVLNRGVEAYIAAHGKRRRTVASLAAWTRVVIACFACCLARCSLPRMRRSSHWITCWGRYLGRMSAG